uniref:Fanconi anemia group I protein n=1 Tax=Ananas comosus var. bracteatus TaxID=296719 RepID=A0A6V7PRG4_ANACO|nr:unnamed protein product [Ananas comosus var. bracteatus]
MATSSSAEDVSSLLSLLSSSTSPSPSLLRSLLRSPRLLPLLPNLDPSLLLSLLDLLASDLASADAALALDLLPPLLALSIDASGAAIAPPILDRILAADWSKALLVKIASILRDLPPKIRVFVPEFVEKVFAGMMGVDLQDLPSLVYQLLLLVSKGICKRMVIAGLLGFFGETLKGPPSIVRQVEGTVLMHFSFAVKQDPSLGQEIVATVRSNRGAVNHFAVAVLLSVARVRRFNESAIGVLRSVVVSSYRDYKLSRDSKWLPDYLKEECLETAKCVEKAFIKAINESNCGREHLVPSIVQLSFLLLESVDSDNREEDGVSSSGGLLGIGELGIQMLKMLFEVHDMARAEIIEQCKFRILSLKPQRSTPVIRLLSCLVQSYPYPMLDHVAHLKELLDYFTFMHEKTATDLINGILPLVKFSHDLQDYIILVVRKAMFKREDTVRIAATNAIVDLIVMECKFKKSGPLQESSSQASCSQQAEITFKSGRELFQDLSGLLRRCLSQQATVKEIVYEGLIKIVLYDPLVANSIISFLWPHFSSFYNEDAASPLKMDRCFKVDNDKICIVEPLDSLLSCVSWILLLQQQSRSDNPSSFAWPCFDFSPSQNHEVGRISCSESFSKALSKIRRFFRKCTSEDKQLQSQNNSSLASGVDVRHCRHLALLGMIECLILISFALRACLHHLKSVATMRSGLSDDSFKTFFYGDVKKLGRPIMQLVWLLKSLPKLEKDSKKKEAKGKRNVESKGTQLFLALLCLKELFMVSLSKGQITEVIEDLLTLSTSELGEEDTLNAAEGINRQEQLIVDDQDLRNLHLFLDNKMKPLYCQLLMLSLPRESEVLSELISNIGRKLPPKQRNSHGIWASRICRNKAVEHPSAARGLVALAFYLLPSPNDMVFLQEISSELRKVMGSEDKEPLETSDTFPIINHSTKNALSTFLIQVFESSLIELDWTLLKIKAILTVSNESTSLGKSQQSGERPNGLELEEALFTRSELIVHLLSSFAEMNLTDSQAEQFLKITTKFYKHLARMTKLQIARKGYKQSLPGRKFQTLAEVTCTMLTAPLYNFVALVQRNQQENGRTRGILRKIKRENRCIPELIFHIEDYEKYLIQLSKITKINLLRHAKRSISRDFRILQAKNVSVEKEQQEAELSQGSSASSKGKSSGDSEGPDEENACKPVLSDELRGSTAGEGSENEKEDEEVSVRRKRAKKSNIVQDSDEER